MFFSYVASDTTLSEIQKLQYLKSCLQGDAEVMLRNVQITAGNFKTAWDLLLNRYDRTRELVKSYLRNLCVINLPHMNIESANDL